MSHKISMVNSEMQKAISEIITFELKNPNIDGIISVSKVDTSNNLEYAKVYVSIFDSKDKENTFHAIQHSARFIRRKLCEKIEIRKIPYLEFIEDNSYEMDKKLDELFDKINSEKGANDGDN